MSQNFINRALASAQETHLKNHTTTLAHEYERQGKDWESELRQRAREKDLMRELGRGARVRAEVAESEEAGLKPLAESIRAEIKRAGLDETPEVQAKKSD